MGTPRQIQTVSEKDIVECYNYMLGRWLVLRQETLDLKEGFKWNELIHREPGGVTWANPNLDVAYSEAWVFVDGSSCTIVELPEIKGRYYTVQVLNGWGEVTANINERNYPKHPFGKFALCLKGAKIGLPADTLRIDLPGRKARVLIRVELGASPAEAVALQKRITMKATGNPRVEPTAATFEFTNDKLPGVEAFESAEAVLASEPDINPGTDALQARVRALAAAIAGSTIERSRVDSIIRQEAWPALKRHVASMGAFSNGWVHPRMAGHYGNEWFMRTVANFIGIWANDQAEVVYFGAGVATPLSGSDTHTATFAKDNLPSSHVRYFWSVTCVDAVQYRVIPNPRNRFLLNNQSQLVLGKDGSLTLFFAPQKPAEAPEGNWLPTPAGQNYVLTWRVYGPDQEIVSGKWFPAPLQKK